MKIKLIIVIYCLIILGFQAVSQNTTNSVIAPKLGDANFPSPSPSERHNQKVSAVKSGNYNLFFIGNSITQTLGEMEGEWAPLKAVWYKHFAPRNSINLGYSGYRTESILWNLRNGELEQQQSPKVAMLLIGTNNLDDEHYKTVHTAEQVFEGTKAIVDLIKQKHPTTKILILRIFVCGGVGDSTPYHRKYNRSLKCIDEVRRAGDMTKRLADGKQVFWLDINHVFLRPDGTINTDLMPDLIHPNAAGAEAWVQAVEPTLSKLLEDKPIIDEKKNIAVIPVPRSDGDYDWMERHNAVLAAKSTNPQIVFIGNSITHHIGGTPTPTGRFISHRGDKFWNIITEKYGNCLNLGFGNDWTQHVLWRIDNGELDGLNPKFVVLEIGTNNILSGNENASEVVEGIRACIIRIRAKTPKAKIILMGIMPCLNPATNSKRLLANKVNEGLKKLAEEAKIQFLDLTQPFLDSAGNIPLRLMDDGIHPTTAGYKIWSKSLIKLLTQD